MTPVATDFASLHEECPTRDPAETLFDFSATLESKMQSPVTKAPMKHAIPQLPFANNNEPTQASEHQQIELGGAKAACDEESIAFGVMYFPRTRV